MTEIINSLANSFAKTTGVPFYLLKDEGMSAWHKAEMKYKEDGTASKTTFVYKCVRNAMITLVNKERKRLEDPNIELQEELAACNKIENHPRKRLYFRESVEDLDTDSLYVVDMCLTNGEALINNAQREIPNGYVFRQELKKYLKRENWTTRRINTSFANVRKFIKEG